MEGLRMKEKEPINFDLISYDINDVLPFLPHIITEDFNHLTVEDVYNVLHLMGMAFSAGCNKASKAAKEAKEAKEQPIAREFKDGDPLIDFTGPLKENSQDNKTIVFSPEIEINIKNADMDYNKLRNDVSEILDKSMKKLEELYDGDVTI